jgi:hypothetical protein
MTRLIVLNCFAMVLSADSPAQAAEIVRVPIDIVGNAMSSDGRWFAGGSGNEAAIWSRDEGLRLLGIPPGYERSVARGISHDGSRVVGAAGRGTFPNDTAEAFVWTAQAGIVGLGALLPGSSSSAASNAGGMADDGTALGRVSYPTRNDIWMLSADGQMTTLGLPPGATDVTSLTVSGGGNFVVGTATDPFRAFIWDRQGGFEELGAGIEFALVSDDGSTVAGRSRNPSVPYRWTRDEGAIPLPMLPGWPRVGGVYDMTPDGSIIVGELINDSSRLAFVWNEQHGTQNLRQILVDQHGFTDAELPPQLGALSSISADAMTLSAVSVSGFAYTERWAIYLDKPLVTIDMPSTWNVDADGNWSLAANWTGGVPNAAGDQVTFGSIIKQAHTVTVDIPIAVGGIEFDNANTYSIAGTNTLTLDVVSGEPELNAINGSHTISAPIMLADDTCVTVTPAASNLSITGTFNATGRNLIKAGAGTLTVNNVRAQALAINGGTVAIAPNGAVASTSVLSGITIAGTANTWTAKLDLANNDAIVQSNAANKSADFNKLHNQVKQGFNSGNWKGQGITSSTAAANPAADTGLSIVDNALLGDTTFSGQPVTADSILIKYTYYGDIDANGRVDADDLTVFASNFGRTSGATQIDGDIDFNGSINADDLTVFANNFLKGVGNPLGATSIQAVPEPSTAILVGFGLVGAAVVVTRRRKQLIG